MDWASKALNAIAAIAVVAAAIAIGGANRAYADDLTDAFDNLAAQVSVNQSGLAARGYDVVAFILHGRALQGRKDIEATHEGATYLFSSITNRDIFVTDPESLVPQLGGYGAYGVRLGRKVAPDLPLVWQVRNDKLYFFADAGTKAMWNTDAPRNEKIAQTIWTQIRTVPAALLVEPIIN